MRLSAFRNYFWGSRDTRYLFRETSYEERQFGLSWSRKRYYEEEDSDFLAYNGRRNGEVIVNMLFRGHDDYPADWDVTTFATIQYLINGNWVNVADKL
ncbi:hypothetical protein AB204_18895 [Xenorhabdus khoisanae]|uniref:Uncharacterized protein n=1 Tax=Xenorhabdus khoisanae TaxID=880157 RepID=A0A0J5FNR5_9GAMM|nr:hypothetical protein AB204_18895 [Xenorhabdus khoisanae]